MEDSGLNFIGSIWIKTYKVPLRFVQKQYTYITWSSSYKKTYKKSKYRSNYKYFCFRHFSMRYTFHKLQRKLYFALQWQICRKEKCIRVLRLSRRWCFNSRSCELYRRVVFVVGYQRFIGLCCLNLQGELHPVTPCNGVVHTNISWTSETLVSYQTTPRHNPEGLDLREMYVQ